MSISAFLRLRIAPQPIMESWAAVDISQRDPVGRRCEGTGGQYYAVPGMSLLVAREDGFGGPNEGFGADDLGGTRDGSFGSDSFKDAVGDIGYFARGADVVDAEDVGSGEDCGGVSCGGGEHELDGIRIGSRRGVQGRLPVGRPVAGLTG
jgi:hypothetical protein